MTLFIKAEISKKRTNFGLFITAIGSREKVHQSKAACKKKWNNARLAHFNSGVI
jgi:hypothetical protein